MGALPRKFRREEIEHRAHALAGVQFAVRREPHRHHDGCHIGQHAADQGLGVADVCGDSTDAGAALDELPLYEMAVTGDRKIALGQVQAMRVEAVDQRVRVGEPEELSL